MALADDEPDTVASALMHAHAAAGRWMNTRFPEIPEYAGRFIGAELTKIIYPYLKVASHAALADSMRAADGMDDVADAIDASARAYLDELLNPKEET